MSRWLAAILATVFLAAAASAQLPPAWQALQNRVKLEPERDWSHEFDRIDPTAAIGVVGMAAVPRWAAAIEAAVLPIADRMAEDRYEKALAEYRHLLNEEEPSLAQPAYREIFGSEGMTSRDVQTLAQDRLARLPPSILDRYRRQIDPIAARLLAEGVSERDPAPLRRLLRDYRASTHADAALALLGDLAFEKGDFDQALAWYRRVAPPPSHVLASRAVGEPVRTPIGVDLPRLHAKQALARLFADRPDADREVDAVGRLYPAATGDFAGRHGAYHVILKEWAHSFRSSKSPILDGDWPTFAGDASRNRALGKVPSDRIWLDGPTWRVPLPTIDAKAPPPVWLSATRPMSIPPSRFHPIIADGQLLVSDGQTVRSYDLLTGKPRFRAPPPPRFAKPRDEDADAATLGLSAAAGRAFARLGAHPGDPRPRRLVALDLRKPGGDPVLWSIEPEGETAYFESDPMAANDRLYVGIAEPGEDETAHLLACYDFVGTRLWTTRLAEVKTSAAKTPPRPGLLVAAGSAVLSVAPGVVVAVDGGSGRRLWAFRYPVIDGAISQRGPSSCLSADGRVFLAPADSQTLFCLDAESGRALWERPWLKPPTDIVPGPPEVSEIVDLLGVVHDRLIFTDRFHVQALDAITGAPLHWQQPALGKLPSQGRGLIAGPWLFWPTADSAASWRAIDTLTGQMRNAESQPASYDPTALRSLPAGNILMGQGCLVVAGATELVVYVPAAAQAPALDAVPEARRRPADWYRLGLAQWDLDRPDRAKECFAVLERNLPLEERDRWRALIAERTEPAVVDVDVRSSAIERVVPDRSAPPEPSSIRRLVKQGPPRPGVAPPVDRLGFGRTADLTLLEVGDDWTIVETATGTEIARTKRRPGRVDWIGQLGDRFLIAGPDGIHTIPATSNESSWLPNPLIERPRGGWQLSGDRPEFWHVPAPRIRAAFDDPRAGGGPAPVRVVYQDGFRAALIDPSLGSREHPIARSGKEWDVVGLGAKPFTFVSVPPVGPSGDGTLAKLSVDCRQIVELGGGVRLVADRRGHVLRFDGDRVKWTYDPGGTPSLVGSPTRLIARDDVVIAVVERNHGCEIVRLDLATGRDQWTLGPLAFPDGFEPSNVALANRVLFFVHRGTLFALDVTTAKTLWRSPLPARAESWRVRLFGEGVIAWPNTTAGVPVLSGPIDPMTATWTLWLGRRGLGPVPIVYLDGTNGRLLQKIEVPYDRGPFFVDVQGSRVIVSASGVVQIWVGAP